MKSNFLYQITAASRTPDLAPRSPFSLSSALNWICWPPPHQPKQNSWICHWSCYIQECVVKSTILAYLEKSSVPVSTSTLNWGKIRWKLSRCWKWHRVNRTQVFERFTMFKSGVVSAEIAQYLGCPSVSRTDADVEWGKLSTKSEKSPLMKFITCLISVSSENSKIQSKHAPGCYWIHAPPAKWVKREWC